MNKDIIFLIHKKQKLFWGYTINQAKKYGLKGTRIGIIKDIMSYIENLNLSEDDLKNKRLDEYLDEIIDKFYNKSFCFQKYIDEKRCLIVLGKVHQNMISMNEFFNRIKKEWNKYGDRAKLAMENKGLDYKALSHAVRCCYQMIELLETGNIVFPLKQKEILKDIKYGKYTWPEVEKIILQKLNDVYNGIEDCKLDWKYNKKFVEDFILSFY